MDKETYFIRMWDECYPEVIGIGECALFRGLSAEDVPEYEAKLEKICQNIVGVQPADLQNGGRRIYFPSDFTTGKKSIEINGLIWMGDRMTMLRRIEQKLEAGFSCIKLKIGAIDFEAELSLLQYIRQRFSVREVELRVDANGAFTPADAWRKLEALAVFDLHSIEQPIRQGQWEEMARLCEVTPIPIALDEELIGINDPKLKEQMLDVINPQYIILKPALAGGLSGSAEWIDEAEKRNIGWWITSALESNVGLNAIAQWTATLQFSIPQGLGTGQLYKNNIISPLVQKGSAIQYDPSLSWDLSPLIWE